VKQLCFRENNKIILTISSVSVDLEPTLNPRKDGRDLDWRQSKLKEMAE